MLQISNSFNVHQNNSNDEWNSNSDNDSYVEKYNDTNNSYTEEEYNERFIMYTNDIRSHFLEDEIENQNIELWLMLKEDKIDKNHNYYLYHSNLNEHKFVNEKNSEHKTLFLDKGTHIFSIQSIDIYIKKNHCSRCGDKCISKKYCKGSLYDDEYEDINLLCNLFPNYIESLLFFKILCQSINPFEMEQYDFRINKLLILKIYKNFNKIDIYNIFDIISYL